MKTLRTIILALAAALLAACAAQRPATPEQIAAHDRAMDILKAQAFMVKADYLTVQNRAIPGVIDNTNFIAVLGDKAIVQVSPGMSGGPNGLGGFTVTGNVTGYKLTTRPGGETVAQYHVSAVVGSCDITVTLARDTPQANVIISNSMRSYRATMRGDIAPIDDSINKGYSRFK